MKISRAALINLIAFGLFQLAPVAKTGATEVEVVRPIPRAVPVHAETDASARDTDEEATPRPKTKRSSRTTRARRESTPEPDYAQPPKPGSGPPTVGARSVIMINAGTGQVLFEKNADETRQAASTQKLLTALIVAEHGFLDQPVRVEATDTLAEPVKLNIKPGETYTRIELLRALLVKSPNDVARCLARDQAGSVDAFAVMMNEKARQLGAVHSHFVNPNGLPIPGQYSSARDLSMIAKAAYSNAVIRSIVCMPKLMFRYANGRVRELENTNKVLTRSPYCNGMKTGYTEAAGHCLISSGSRPGRDIIVVVLGDSKAGVWRDSAALLTWGLWM